MHWKPLFWAVPEEKWLLCHERAGEPWHQGCAQLLLWPTASRTLLTPPGSGGQQGHTSSSSRSLQAPGEFPGLGAGSQGRAEAAALALHAWDALSERSFLQWSISALHWCRSTEPSQPGEYNEPVMRWCLCSGVCPGTEPGQLGARWDQPPAQRTMARLSKGLWRQDPALVTGLHLGLLPAL